MGKTRGSAKRSLENDTRNGRYVVNPVSASNLDRNSGGVDDLRNESGEGTGEARTAKSRRIRQLTEEEAQQVKTTNRLNNNVIAWFHGEYDFAYGGSFPLLPRDRHEEDAARESYLDMGKKNYIANSKDVRYYNQAVWVLASFCGLGNDPLMACSTCGDDSLWNDTDTGREGHLAMCVLLEQLRTAGNDNMDDTFDERAFHVRKIMKRHADLLSNALSYSGKVKLMDLVDIAPYDSGIQYISQDIDVPRFGNYSSIGDLTYSRLK